MRRSPECFPWIPACTSIALSEVYDVVHLNIQIKSNLGGILIFAQPLNCRPLQGALQSSPAPEETERRGRYDRAHRRSISTSAVELCPDGRRCEYELNFKRC